MKNRPSKLVPLLLLAGIVVIAGGYAFSSGILSDEAQGAVRGVDVVKGPLRISVMERGNLKAANSTTLKCELEGRSTVLSLVEEGTMVQPGDVVGELDSSEIVDRKVQQDIKVQNALADYTKAKQNHAIQVSQNESDIARGERELEFAQLDLRKFEEGDVPEQLKAADETILLRQEEEQRAEQDLAWSQKLAERGFLEQSQLDADLLAFKRAEVALDQALRAKELLVEYEIPRQRKEYEAEVLEKGGELERIRLQADARLADFTANLATSKAKYELEREELVKLESQLEKAVLRAPTAGMVVYAVEQRSRWGGGTPMQEGAEVRERQDIITIPSSEGYLAEASIHETLLEKVSIGMPCLVTIDALRETFRGEVAFKAVLPDQNSWYANPDLRVYRTEVRILDRDPRMRPGMSCSVEILVDELEDVLHVPVQCVFLDGGETVALVRERDSVRKRPVRVGQNDGEWVHVISGLAEGETVLLSRPPEISLAPAEEKAELARPDWGRRPEGGASGTGVPGTGRPGGPAGAGRGQRPTGAASAEVGEGQPAPAAAHGEGQPGAWTKGAGDERPGGEGADTSQ